MSVVLLLPLPLQTNNDIGVPTLPLLFAVVMTVLHHHSDYFYVLGVEGNKRLDGYDSDGALKVLFFRWLEALQVMFARRLLPRRCILHHAHCVKNLSFVGGGMMRMRSSVSLSFNTITYALLEDSLNKLTQTGTRNRRIRARIPPRTCSIIIFS